MQKDMYEYDIPCLGRHKMYRDPCSRYRSSAGVPDNVENKKSLSSGELVQSSDMKKEMYEYDFPCLGRHKMYRDPRSTYRPSVGVPDNVENRKLLSSGALVQGLSKKSLSSGTLATGIDKETLSLGAAIAGSNKKLLSSGELVRMF